MANNTRNIVYKDGYGNKIDSVGNLVRMFDFSDVLRDRAGSNVPPPTFSNDSDSDTDFPHPDFFVDTDIPPVGDGDDDGEDPSLWIYDDSDGGDTNDNSIFDSLPSYPPVHRIEYVYNNKATDARPSIKLDNDTYRDTKRIITIIGAVSELHETDYDYKNVTEEIGKNIKSGNLSYNDLQYLCQISINIKDYYNVIMKEKNMDAFTYIDSVTNTIRGSIDNNVNVANILILIRNLLECIDAVCNKKAREIQRYDINGAENPATKTLKYKPQLIEKTKTVTEVNNMLLNVANGFNDTIIYLLSDHTNTWNTFIAKLKSDADKFNKTDYNEIITENVVNTKDNTGKNRTKRSLYLLFGLLTGVELINIEDKDVNGMYHDLSKTCANLRYTYTSLNEYYYYFEVIRNYLELINMNREHKSTGDNTRQLDLANAKSIGKVWDSITRLYKCRGVTEWEIKTIRIQNNQVNGEVDGEVNNGVPVTPMQQQPKSETDKNYVAEMTKSVKRYKKARLVIDAFSPFDGLTVT